MVDLISPPFPTDGTTDTVLYLKLVDLRDWVLHYRAALNEALGGELIPEPREMPDLEVYLTQTVAIKFSHLMYLRQVRGQWDDLVRTYEEAWDCKNSVQGQAMLVQASCLMLNGAFTPYEVREMKEEEEQLQFQKGFEVLRRTIFGLMEKAASGENEDSEED